MFFSEEKTVALINISNLTFAYEGSYDYIFKNVSFQIDTDWKLGFTGRNGRGKTTFLQLLRGKYEYSGSISVSVDFECFPYEIADPGVIIVDFIYRIDPANKCINFICIMLYCFYGKDRYT